MNSYRMDTVGICPHEIDFSLENGRVYNVRFQGGCPGNTTAVGILPEGTDARLAVSKLKGIKCGRRPTSCCDQLARGIEQALASEEPEAAYKGDVAAQMEEIAKKED